MSGLYACNLIFCFVTRLETILHRIKFEIFLTFEVPADLTYLNYSARISVIRVHAFSCRCYLLHYFVCLFCLIMFYFVLFVLSIILSLSHPT